MARLFTCGFEENNFTATMWTTNAGSVVADTTNTPHSGTYHCKYPNNSVGCKRTFASSNNTWNTRVYWKATVFPTSGTITTIFQWRDAGNAQMYSIQFVRATGVLRINNAKASTTVDSTFALSTSTYYRLETILVPSATVGSVELKLYLGDSLVPLDDISLLSQNTGTNVQDFWIGSTVGENTGYTFYVDDIAINDSTGSFQTGLPGPGKISLLKPAGDTSVQWTKSGSSPAATNFGGVAEVPGTPDDAVTYNEDSGTTNVDKLAMTATPAEMPPTAILSVADVMARVSAGAASQTLIMRFWDEAGTSTDGPSASLGNGTWSALTTNHLPVNISGKTKANADLFSVGYKGNSGASAKRVTSVWVNIDWIEANYYNVSPPKVVGQSVKRVSYF